MNLISIIVPCYNQARYLDDCLQSVLEQTYTNWECIIVNDGSPDNTVEIAKKWVDKDSRFLYLFKNNGGLSSARNEGVSISKGEFILPLDADDKIANDYIFLAVEEFRKAEGIKVVYCQAEKFGSEFGIWNLPDFSIENLARVNMIFCTAMYKKNDWELVGGYDTNMIYGLEDWEFWIAILKNGGEVKCINKVGFYYRINKDSMARTINSEQRKFSEEYVGKKHIDFILKNYDTLLTSNTNLVATNNSFKNNFKSKKILINQLFSQLFGFKIFKAR